jgi:aspartate racemase
MHIGLISGIGPAATDYYHRRLTAAFSARQTPLNLNLTITHADTATLLANLAENNIAEQAAIFASPTHRLARAGADCVAVTSIAGHFCIDAFATISPLPVINMITTINDAVADTDLKRIGILGTRAAMQTRLFGGITATALLPPEGEDLANVHQAYVDMAAAGRVTDAQRAVFDHAANRVLNEQNAEAIMLGGTDLAMVYTATNSSFPVIDCAALHVDAITRRPTD